MPTDKECFCCSESDLIIRVRGSNDCITEHKSFKSTVLNMDTLNTARHILKSFTKDPEMKHKLTGTENRMWRFIAYRQIVSWINSWNTLGRHHRIVIPACAVIKIRELYPELSGDYVGYKTSVPGEEPEYPY
jgi:hypothetical protein